MRTLEARQWRTHSLGREDGDLRDTVFLAEAVEKINPDVVFNTVAWTQVDAAEDDENEAMQWNRALPASLARMVKGSSRLLVHYSTDFVFSGESAVPYGEDDEPAPLSVYGASKLAGETVVLETIPDSACVIRSAWLFGPGRKNFVSAILDACRKRDAVSVVHDQIGSPTYTMDLAYWSALLAEKRATGLFHAVNSGRASWCELACEAVTITESPCRVDPITSDQWPQKAVRPRSSVLAVSRLSSVLGLTPRPWPQALRDYLFQEYLNTRQE